MIFLKEESNFKERKHINYKGELLEVSAIDIDNYKVDRVITTNLKAYLDEELQPGAIIKI
jgi:hypothetical protein